VLPVPPRCMPCTCRGHRKNDDRPAKYRYRYPCRSTTYLQAPVGVQNVLPKKSTTCTGSPVHVPVVPFGSTYRYLELSRASRVESGSKQTVHVPSFEVKVKVRLRAGACYALCSRSRSLCFLLGAAFAREIGDVLPPANIVQVDQWEPCR